MSQLTKVNFRYIKRRLKFTFDAGTSRGVLKTRDVYWIEAKTYENGNRGWGEAAPLIGLSPDFSDHFEKDLFDTLQKVQSLAWSAEPSEILMQVEARVSEKFPSIRFAVESALLDLSFGGKKQYFENDFFEKSSPIPINGLIWMGEEDFMKKQIDEKLNQGFDCIKMKIGAIDFEKEIKLLEYIRRKYSHEQVTLRVDANGAFTLDEAYQKLKRLAALDLHSIEQPVKAGQIQEMKELCATSPLPIALDEELIGISEKESLLKEIKPQYIILKPSLLGGIKSTQEWIDLAGKQKIGWWMTSALESNIGLNVISQLTSTYKPIIPQGLGTGSLYHNNLNSPLEISSGKIYYKPRVIWENPN